MDIEDLHRLVIKGLSLGIIPKIDYFDSMLKTKVFNIDFPNPIGLAAGFDKNAEAYKSLLHLGFGSVEVGTITLYPNQGNLKPRLFRLSEDKAIINRYGFNNDGWEIISKRLKKRDKTKGIVGINVEPEANIIRKASILADYVVINISSPNTIKPRQMQNANNLDKLLHEIGNVDSPLLLKLSPDLNYENIKNIISVAMNRGISGLIISNTTIKRLNSLKSKHSNRMGGLSGAPLNELSTDVIAKAYVASSGRLPIIGCGGISSPDDAYKKIRAGASLLQIYTSFCYQGPWVIKSIIKGLSKRLQQDKFDSIKDAVGIDSLNLNEEKWCR